MRYLKIFTLHRVWDYIFFSRYGYISKCFRFNYLYMKNILHVIRKHTSFSFLSISSDTCTFKSCAHGIINFFIYYILIKNEILNSIIRNDCKPLIRFFEILRLLSSAFLILFPHGHFHRLKICFFLKYMRRVWQYLCE